MDASTVQFHRALVRHLKGALKSYQRWIDEQVETATLGALKQRKADLAREREEEMETNKET